jgi:hypothetical protein
LKWEEMNKRVVGWLQKPRTVCRREEVLQRVDLVEWHGSEIGKQHEFLSSGVLGKPGH